jgi:hypothetical protein
MAAVSLNAAKAKREQAMNINLTDEEQQALLRLIKDALESPRYPLSPEVEALRRVAEKLEADEKRRPSRTKE